MKGSTQSRGNQKTGSCT